MVAAAVIGGAVVGGVATSYSANKAAGAQKDAANRSIDAQYSMYSQNREDLSPYRMAGENALTSLQDQLPYLTSPIRMDQAALEQTPGYQFTLQQGLKGVQNSAAARGLANSGAALKGAAQYATGLADNTYLNQFNLENTNRTNAYNRLLGVSQLGQNAAAQTGAFGQQAANQVSNAYGSIGDAQAAAALAQGNALQGGANNVSNLYLYDSYLRNQPVPNGFQPSKGLFG